MWLSVNFQFYILVWRENLPWNNKKTFKKRGKKGRLYCQKIVFKMLEATFHVTQIKIIQSAADKASKHAPLSADVGENSCVSAPASMAAGSKHAMSGMTARCTGIKNTPQDRRI